MKTRSCSFSYFSLCYPSPKERLENIKSYKRLLERRWKDTRDSQNKKSLEVSIRELNKVIKKLKKEIKKLED